MPATNYKSNNAYEPDYERYNRTYTRSRSAYRVPPSDVGYARPRVSGTQPRMRTAEPRMRTAAPTYAPRRTASAPAVRREQAVSKRPARVSAAKKRAARKGKLKTFAKCAIVFVLAIFMIYRYVMISETGAKINELQNTYTGLSGSAQELQSKIDKSIDLESLEKRAEEDLGMVRPDRNQIFYVDMNGDDYGESTESEAKTGGISGASGSIIRAIDMIK